MQLLWPLFGTKNPAKAVWAFFTNSTFGNLDLMRVDLSLRFTCERAQVRSDDGTDIDCMYFPSNKTGAPTMLVCNPNAGYYEYAYF